MSKLVHYTVYFLLVWLGRAFSCPDYCICDRHVVDNYVGNNVDCAYAFLSSLPSMPQDTLLLDFSENLIRVIPPSIKHLTNLRELDLSHNRLGYDNDEKLPNDMFSTLVYLRVLDLSGNYLKTFSRNTFNGLVRLEKLDLHNNKIVHLPLGMLQLLPNAAVVCLGDNDWNCSMCQFHETLEWYLSDDRNDVTDVCNMEVPSCFSPPAFKGRRFTELSLEEIDACDEEKLITTLSTFISTSTELSSELSNVTVDSQHMSAGTNTHKTNDHTTTSPEFYNNSGKADF